LLTVLVFIFIVIFDNYAVLIDGIINHRLVEKLIIVILFLFFFAITVCSLCSEDGAEKRHLYVCVCKYCMYVLVARV